MCIYIYIFIYLRLYTTIFHNSELLTEYCEGGKSRRMRWAGHMARMGQGRGVHRVLMGKPEGKKPLGKSRRRWEDNIKMDLQEGVVGTG